MMPFWIALQFLTVCPVELKKLPSAQQNANSLLFYPLIGFGIGVILWAIATLLSSMPLILSSMLVLAIWIYLTGGLHLDGLADTSDAWVGGFGDRERTLVIMKDPSCGPIGVLSLFICLGLKYASIYILIEKQHAFLLVLIPLISRLGPLILFLMTPYVRSRGLGSSIAENLSKWKSMAVIILCICISLYWSLIGIVGVLSFAIALYYLRRKFMKRLQGITGDTVGAAIEITEMVSLVAMVIALSYS